ncbi:monosaccharide ABC transporter substrate-binding protein (CUT2 family) [Roseiarcus fermentans]|uniref:Monosaccharide ABC transporter substrate-binding protein (CUT2 family) n=1 Tax=Roseiarcus fermentans TaxID=1473586 RepID=A0A366FU99_9HYPH|nr:substrate-binding domain-containing protein [Roseiarcus fermentans]RBP17269.1 monosaccharide ABC transporter substrate-binding protein (CUT2 family) [Roseiarcus fermentans]
MTMTRRGLAGFVLGLLGATALGSAAWAAGEPAPFDHPEKVKIALVRYLSTGDFFQSYLAGVQAQAKALGVDLHVFDSRQDAALQADMVDQAIALGVNGIIIQHGLTESMKEAAARAVKAGIKVVAFDVNVENDKIPQIEQSDRDLARLALEQAIKDNGESWKAGYVYVAGIAPLDRRDETWKAFKAKYPGIKEVAMFGTLDNPIANSVANQARSVISAHPDITVMFAPYDEFAKGVKIAVDEAGMSSKVKIYSADISTSDISAMREPGSAWAATAATNPAVVGQVSVRALAMLLAGEDPGHEVIVPPTLITQKQLNDNDIKNMEELAVKLPQFAHADVAVPKWMPLPGAK